MEKVDKMVKQFHDKCVSLVEKTMKEEGFNIPFTFEFNTIHWGFVFPKILKFKYYRAKPSSVLRVERKAPWYSNNDYFFDDIWIATDENMEFINHYGEGILKEIPKGVREEIKNIRYEREKDSLKEMNLKNRTISKLNKLL